MAAQHLLRLVHQCGDPCVSSSLHDLAEQFAELEEDGVDFVFTNLLIDNDDEGGLCLMAAYELVPS